jgi:hypothetical protein
VTTKTRELQLRKVTKRRLMIFRSIRSKLSLKRLSSSKSKGTISTLEVGAAISTRVVRLDPPPLTKQRRPVGGTSNFQAARWVLQKTCQKNRSDNYKNLSWFSAQTNSLKAQIEARNTKIKAYALAWISSLCFSIAQAQAEWTHRMLQIIRRDKFGLQNRIYKA